MNNSETFSPSVKTRYRMLKHKNGSVAFATCPEGGSVTIEGAEEVVELEMTKEEWQELRTTTRQAKLDFAAAKRALAKNRQPDTGNPVDTIKE